MTEAQMVERIDALVGATTRIADALEKRNQILETAPVKQTEASSPTPVSTQPAQRSATQRTYGGTETIHLMKIREVNPFKNGTGYFYKGVINENGLEAKASLGVKTADCATTFAIGQEVVCTASRKAKLNAYGEIEFWFVKLIEVKQATQPVADSGESEEDDMDVPW